MALENEANKVLLSLNRSGQVATTLQGRGMANGVILVYEESLHLKRNETMIPVVPTWKVWRGDPWVIYGADGHWTQNTTSITFGPVTAYISYFPFNETGADFHLRVDRRIFGQVGVTANNPPLVTPCLGPD